MIFSPNLSILPPQLLRFWPELDTMPETFTLYAGTVQNFTDLEII